MSGQTAVVARRAEGELAVLSRAAAMLSKVESLDEVKDIRDKAEALAKYAKATKLGLQAQNSAAEIKIRAERRGGELLKEMKDRGERRRGHGDQKSERRNVTPKLADI